MYTQIQCTHQYIFSYERYSELTPYSNTNTIYFFVLYIFLHDALFHVDTDTGVEGTCCSTVPQLKQWHRNTVKQWLQDLRKTEHCMRRCKTDKGSVIPQARSRCWLYQYLKLWMRMQNIHLHSGREDKICWHWTSTQQYIAKSAYEMFFCENIKFPGATLISKAWVSPKTKLIMYLAMQRRTWTSERRLCHGLKDNADCALCRRQEI